MKSKKQKAAISHNFNKFRLGGLIATLSQLMDDDKISVDNRIDLLDAQVKLEHVKRNWRNK